MLFKRCWTVDEPKAAVVLVHGLAEHSGRYEHVARRLNASGYAVYARDIRGHGRSVGFPGDTGGSYSTLVDDLAEQIRDVGSSYEKTFVYAHSAGTLIAVPAAALTAPAGLVLSGTAIEPTQEAVASIAVGDLDPSALSRDPETVRGYVSDPLVFAGRIPPETLALLLEAGPATVEALPRVTCPVLAVHGGSDRICSVDGAKQVLSEIGSVDKQLKVYPELYHEVHNEPERDRVLSDIVSWLDVRQSGR